jgi:hypothetical protein
MYVAIDFLPRQESLQFYKWFQKWVCVPCGWDHSVISSGKCAQRGISAPRAAHNRIYGTAGIADSRHIERRFERTFS